MKRVLAGLMCLALLASCGIEVDDLGDNWNKGVIDPRLAGKWLSQDTKSSEVGTFTDVGGMYRIEGQDDKRHDADLAKTLRVGNYNFLMAGPRSAYTLTGHKGDLYRYLITGDMLQVCNLKVRQLSQFLKEKYPQDKNMTMHECRRKKKGEMCWEYLEIHTLDAESLKILSNIPNDDSYWECGAVLKKIK